MKKRIKTYTPEREELIEDNQNNQEKGLYVELLITDLKSEPRTMPRYSFWSEMVNKGLQEKSKEN